MRSFIIRLLSCLIFNREKRRAFRQKLMANTKLLRYEEKGGEVEQLAKLAVKTLSLPSGKTFPQSISFKTYGDLYADIQRNLHKIPSNIDLVVGIPRSGMLPAYMIGFLRHLPVCSLDEFCNGLISSEYTARSLKGGDVKNVLVIDDSLLRGNSMRKAKDKIAKSSIGDGMTIKFASVYVLPEAEKYCDYALMQSPSPRMFQWNYLNHSFIQDACFDIDGVLCVDPTHEQNDDGEKYRYFLRTATPLHIPQYEIFALVTSRLEKYRKETEEWLMLHGVKYRHLIMLNVPTKQDRIALGAHAQFKSEIYKRLANTVLFYESEKWQATYIAEQTGKTVFCVSTNELIKLDNSAERALQFSFNDMSDADKKLVINGGSNIILQRNEQKTNANLEANAKKTHRQLEIGPGLSRISGFETLNIVDGKDVDYIADITQTLPFLDDTFDLVFASHILEHAPWFMQSFIFAELHRIIKFNGKLEIWVPDGMKIVQTLCEYETENINNIDRDGWYRFNEAKDVTTWANGRIYSYGNGTADTAHFNWHKTLFTFRHLQNLCLQAGFSEIEILDKRVRGTSHGWVEMGICATKR